MKQAAGVMLIVFGLLAGASTASLNVRAEKAGKPARERFFESVGGALCCLTLVVPGFILALAGGKKSDGKYRPPPQPHGQPDSGREPKPAEPGAAQPLPRVVGADGKIVLTCLACYADVRVNVSVGVKVVDCPGCGREIRVASS